MEQNALQTELDRIDAELVRLHAQRDLLLRLLGRESRQVAWAPPALAALRTSSRPALRPTNPRNTEAIIALVTEHPGKLTLVEVVDRVAKQMNADEEKRRQLYNTGYGLKRRNRLIEDSRGRLTAAVE